MPNRTFGWVQNPADLAKLKKVVSIFEPNSKVNLWLVNERLPLLNRYKLISKQDYTTFREQLTKETLKIDYNLLKGKGSSGRRADAICTGIVQAVIDAQQSRTYAGRQGSTITIKKPYVDDWTADGYLRWAISCGLLEYNIAEDTCKISDLGRKLAMSEADSCGETEALSVALLSYPPVIRILSLLKQTDELTKFELGKELGFKGELGFTSIPQAAYLCDYCEAPANQKTSIRNNEEGDSDKYARGIASWLMQMGWVTKSTKQVTEIYREKSYTAKLQAYSITRAGEKALIMAKGNSSNKRIPRIVMFEMLASNKAPGANYLRYERASILNTLSVSSKSLKQIATALKTADGTVSESTVKDHIKGLYSIGIEITERNGKYKLHDMIKSLVLPQRSKCSKEIVNDIKDRVRDRLINVKHDYLALIDLAYSDAAAKSSKNSDAREFEIQTASLFVNEMGFSGKRLGDANRPDIIISYGNCGTIIDNKSYKDGFNIPVHSADEMGRYVNENQRRLPCIPPNEWWKEFPENVCNFTFLFVTSYLKGNFEQQLEYISNTHSGINGGAISVENLLYLAENIKSGRLGCRNFFDDFANKELTYTTV